MKCSICEQKIQTTFLSKIVGTYVRKNGKQHPICSACQEANQGKDLASLIS